MYIYRRASEIKILYISILCISILFLFLCLSRKDSSYLAHVTILPVISRRTVLHSIRWSAVASLGVAVRARTLQQQCGDACVAM